MMMEWTINAACMRSEDFQNIWSENLKGEDLMKDLD
jgi:hypothetical protein